MLTENLPRVEISAEIPDHACSCPVDGGHEVLFFTVVGFDERDLTDCRLMRCGGPVRIWGQKKTSQYWSEVVAMLHIVPMRLGDIFDRTFRIIGRIFLRSAIIVLLLLVPACALLIAGMSEFYANIGDAMRGVASGQAASMEDVPFVLLGLLALCVPAVLLADLAVELCIITLTAADISGIPLTWQQALGRVAGVRLFRALGVVLLQALTFGAVFLVPFIFLALSAGDVGLMAFALLVMLATFAFLAFLLIRWAFAFTSVACEDTAVIASLQRSWFLVKGSWWRTFGILFLFNILASFAISILTSPVSFVGFWGYYQDYFKMLGSAASGAPDPAAMADLIGSMGIGIGVSLSLSIILFAFIRPVYTTVLYFDLRARRQEFGVTLEPPIQGEEPIQFIEIT
jgi:hypothetical protein